MAWSKGKRSRPAASYNCPPKTRRRILRKYPTCWLNLSGICEVQSVEVHHIVEVASGGSDDDTNLVGVCKPCHARVSAQYAVKKRDWWQRRPERHPGVLE